MKDFPKMTGKFEGTPICPQCAEGTNVIDSRSVAGGDLHRDAIKRMANELLGAI